MSLKPLVRSKNVNEKKILGALYNFHPWPWHFYHDPGFSLHGPVKLTKMADTFMQGMTVFGKTKCLVFSRAHEDIECAQRMLIEGNSIHSAMHEKNILNELTASFNAISSLQNFVMTIERFDHSRAIKPKFIAGACTRELNLDPRRITSLIIVPST